MKRLLAIQVYADRLSTALADRTPRERLLLGGLAATTALAVIYLGIWQPLQTMRNSYVAAIGRQDALTEQIAAIAAEPAPIRQATDTRPPAVIVSDRAAAASLAIRRLEPADDRVSVVLEDADFVAVLNLLDALDRDTGLVVSLIDMTRRPEPGVVSTSFTLRR